MASCLNDGGRGGREGGRWYVLSVETVRDEIQVILDQDPQNCKEFFLSWIVSVNEVKKI